MSKLPTIKLFITPNSPTTKILNKFIAENIDRINQHFYIERISINSQNVNAIKKMGITQTPSLIFNRQLIVGLQQIIQVLKPPPIKHQKPRFNELDPEGELSNFQKKIIDEGEEDEVDKNEDFQKKAAIFQKRRPEMQGVDDHLKIPGGQKIKTRNDNIKSTFKSDDEFLGQTNKGANNYNYNESMGDEILEDYYLGIAKEHGDKKVSKPRRKIPKG